MQKTQVLIIGAGPAGYTAAIYAARAGLDTTLFTGIIPGGQLTLTQDVENYPGFIHISGIELTDAFRNQAQSVGVNILSESITQVQFKNRPFLLKSDTGNDWLADTVIIATGASSRWLGVPGENTFKGKGISICATCDGFFYRGKTVAVIGGGNTAVYEARYLAQIAERVFLIHRDNTLTAEKNQAKSLLKNPKITPYWNTEIIGFIGDERLKAVQAKNILTGDIFTINIDGVFEAVGHIPNSRIFQGQLEIDEKGFIKTNCQNRQTSVEGIFACGDVQEPFFRQAIIATGSGCVAALSAEKFILSRT